MSAPKAAPAYPTIVVEPDDDGMPLGWGALSGAGRRRRRSAGKLYAVTDSVYRSAAAIFTIDATQNAGADHRRRPIVTRDGEPAQKLDLEGIALDGDGGFWLASEGRHRQADARMRSCHVDAKGEIDRGDRLSRRAARRTRSASASKASPSSARATT